MTMNKSGEVENLYNNNGGKGWGEDGWQAGIEETAWPPGQTEVSPLARECYLLGVLEQLGEYLKAPSFHT